MPMHKWFRCLVPILTLFPFLGSSSGQTAKPASGQSDAEIRAILAERLNTKFETGMVAGLIERGGTRVISAGKTGNAGAPAPDGDTVFEIGSATKVFTSALLASMVERGEVILEDPIAKYLPSSVKVPAKSGKQITLLDLATHSSGLPRLPGNMNPKDPANPYADYSVEQMYTFLSGYELTRDKSQGWYFTRVDRTYLGRR